jgi:hypothetical protein
MGASLNHTNVNATAIQTLCGPNCDDLGAILLESNSTIHKMSLIPTSLSLRSDQNLTLNGSLRDDQGTLTASFTSFGDLSLSTLASLTSGQVSFVAAEDITIYGQVNCDGIKYAELHGEYIGGKCCHLWTYFRHGIHLMGAKLTYQH